jgi:thiamine-monophosphate kinase
VPASEFDIIRRYFEHHGPARADVALGIGDDAALLAPPSGQQLAVSVDTLVAGVHFPLETGPEAIGHKSLAVNLSDLAAMGAEPAWATLALTLPAADEAWLAAFCEGFFAAAREHNVALVGGDTTHGPLSITVQIMGFVPPGQALTRAGAKAGDDVFVTGTLGDAGAGLRVVQGTLRVSSAIGEQLKARLDRPTPRVAAGLALRGLASAAIDISDGLAADLGHILEASDVGAELELAKLPLSDALRQCGLPEPWRLVATAGDDYELCFTLPPENEREALARLAALGCPATRIGTITAAPGLKCVDTSGKVVTLDATGYDHFAHD